MVSCHVKRVKPTDTSDEDIAARNLESEGCTTTCRRVAADLQDKLYSTPTSAVLQPRYPIHSAVEILGVYRTANPVSQPPRHDISVARVSVDHVVRQRSFQYTAIPARAALSECRVYVRENKATTTHFQVPVVSPFGGLRTHRRPQSRRPTGLLLLGCR